MDSSREAFSKLEMWKNSAIFLKLSILSGVEHDIVMGSLAGVDEKNRLVLFAVDSERKTLPRIDLSDASFTVGERRVEAFRGPEDVLTFEEVLVC
jgi:hypothetical protein